MTEDELVAKYKRNKRLKELALSGIISGGVLGAGGKAISGAKKLSDILKAGAVGAGAGGALSLGSGAIGGAVLGEAGENEESAHTKRGSLGGALGGALVGGLAGGVATSAKARALVMKLANKYGKGASVKDAFASKDSAGNVTNILLDKIKKINNPKIGAAVGAGTLGSVAAYQGADEGMQLDFVESLRRERQRKKAMEDRFNSGG